MFHHVLETLFLEHPQYVETEIMYEGNGSTTIFNNSTFLPTRDPPIPNNNNNSVDDVFGYVLVLIAGATLTLGQIIQKARLQTTSTLILNFYSGMIATIVPLILSLATEDMVFPSGRLYSKCIQNEVANLEQSFLNDR